MSGEGVLVVWLICWFAICVLIDVKGKTKSLVTVIGGGFILSLVVLIPLLWINESFDEPNRDAGPTEPTVSDHPPALTPKQQAAIADRALAHYQSMLRDLQNIQKSLLKAFDTADGTWYFQELQNAQGMIGMNYPDGPLPEIYSSSIYTTCWMAKIDQSQEGRYMFEQYSVHFLRQALEDYQRDLKACKTAVARGPQMPTSSSSDARNKPAVVSQPVARSATTQGNSDSTPLIFRSSVTHP